MSCSFWTVMSAVIRIEMELLKILNFTWPKFSSCQIDKLAIRVGFNVLIVELYGNALGL